MWDKYPVLRPAIFFVTGVLVYAAFLELAHPPLWISFALFALTGLVSVFPGFLRKQHIFPYVVLPAFFFLGCFLTHWHVLKIEHGDFGRYAVHFGVVKDNPKEKRRWYSIEFQNREGGRSLAYIAKDDSLHPTPPDLVKGDSIWLLSYFNQPTSPYVRHSQEKRDTLFRSFESYKSYLFYKGVSTIMYCSSGAWGYLRPSSDNADSVKWASQHERLRTNSGLSLLMRERYRQADFTDEAAAVVEAMTTGNKEGITSEIRDNFSNAGLSHVLALSGFHLTVIVGLLDILLMRGFLLRRWRRITALLVVACIWAFAYIAGFPPSLVRATVMCTVFQLAWIAGNSSQMGNAASLACFVMLMANPLLSKDVGFQLSFLSIVGIAVMGIPLSEWLHSRTGRWAYVLDILAISFTCTLFTFPVVAYHFGRIPLYSLLSNLFVSLIAVAIMWTSVLWWILCWLNPAVQLMTWILNRLTDAMLAVAETVSGLPYSTIAYSPNILEVIALYVVITLSLVFVRKKKRRLAIVSAVLLAVLPLLHLIPKSI